MHTRISSVRARSRGVPPRIDVVEALNLHLGSTLEVFKVGENSGRLSDVSERSLGV